MKTCVFVTSFSERLPLVTEFIRRYERSGVELPLLVFCDAPDPGISHTAVWIEDSLRFSRISRLNALLYRGMLRFSCRLRRRAIPYSDNLLGYTPLWGRRLDSAISFMLRNGYTHAIWCCDDGWFTAANIERLSRVIHAVNRYKPGYFRLTEKLCVDGKLDTFRKIEEDVVELLPSRANLPCHYVSHQTSLWDLDVLAKISKRWDCACRHENSGTYRFYDGGFKALEYEGTPVIASLGVFSDGGFIFSESGD